MYIVHCGKFLFQYYKLLVPQGFIRVWQALSSVLKSYCHVSGVPWRIITGPGLDDWIYWHLPLQSLLITITYNSSQSMTAQDSLHSLLDYECLLFYCDWLGSDLRSGQLFSSRCPLVNTPQLNTQPSSTTELLNSLPIESRWLLIYEWIIQLRVLPL
jgi:hypothetical protein